MTEWEDQGERLTIPAPALEELLRSGDRRGGRFLERSLLLARRLEGLPLDAASAAEAARLGGEGDRRGDSPGSLELLIAAIIRLHREVLVTRDRDFTRVPGVQIETY